MPNAYKVAAVQAEPIWFDLDATVTKTIDLIGQAANADAQLVAFPETWIPGYPHFLWLGSVANQMPYVAQYHANSLSTKGPEIAAIRAFDGPVTGVIVNRFLIVRPLACFAVVGVAWNRGRNFRVDCFPPETGARLARQGWAGRVQGLSG